MSTTISFPSAVVPGRRAGLRELCSKYIVRQTRVLNLRRSTDLLHSLDNLVAANQKTYCVSFVVGGPFTEALILFRRTGGPRNADIMAGSLIMDRNFIKGIQYNFWADFGFADDFLGLATKKQIPLRLTPTECGKGVENEPCPLGLSLGDYEAFLGKGSLG